MTLRIRVANTADLVGITELLTAAGLPSAGVSDWLSEFLIAEHDSAIVGSAGMEIYGASALLRSVAVRSSHRGQGLARQLVEDLLDRARRKGLHRIYLLTETAAPYFQQLGFALLPREHVDRAVQASKEFQDLCAETAIAMAQSLQLVEQGEGSHD